MKNLYLSLFFLSMSSFLVAQIAVTLQVDMSNETVSADGVHVAGSFQGWDPAATPMTDDDMDNVYEVVLDLAAGMHEFKFINGAGWDYAEDVPPTCQVEVLGNDNRFLILSETDTEASVHVCFASCAACGMSAVRFRVDMNLESAVSPNGVHVAGNFQGWEPSTTSLTDDNDDGIWEAIVPLDTAGLEGVLNFKFVNGNAWPNPNENITDEACSDGVGNRVLTISDQNMVLFGDVATGGAPCYNACGTCSTPTEVTFRVDMTTQETVSVNGVHVAGSFQGWSANATPLNDDDGDGIWEVTLGIVAADIQFKFINGNDWSGNGDGNVDNELIVGDCAAEGSDNRALTVGDEAIVYEVCYNSCESGCVENPDPADVTFRVEMTEEEVSASGVWVIGNFTSPNWQMGALQMTDDDVNGVYEITANVSGGTTILYKFVNGDPSTGDNGVDYTEESGIQLDVDNNEITNFEVDGCGLANGFGAYNRIHERDGTAEILDAVCFNKCSTCVVSVIEQLGFVVAAYPNPFNETLTVQFDSQNEVNLIRILDVSGREVKSLQINRGTQQLELNTSSWRTGMYTLDIRGERMSSSVLLIKQ